MHKALHGNTLSEQFFNLRNRFLSSASFQNWAQKNPFTQWLARRRVRQLFHLCTGFVHTQVLLACVQAGLFERLQKGPLPLARIATAIGLSEQRTATLLAAANALQLIERRPDDVYGLGVLGAALCGNPSLVDMVQHHRLLYQDLDDPLGMLRGDAPTSRLSHYWPYAAAGNPVALASQEVREYTQLMASSQQLVCDQILSAYVLRQHRRMLDIGGGDGTFLLESARRWPGLQLALFDLPPVAAIASQRIEAAGLSGRISTLSGDFHCEPLPTGYDLMTLVRVVHDHDDPEVLRLLRAIRVALAPGGVLLIAEPLAAADSGGRLADAYFSFYLAAMGKGRPRTRHSLEKLLEQAGFRHFRWHRTSLPILVSVLSART
ncbi:MAG TPA: methyltransferase [Woeseiaceae bacterium]